MRPLILLGLALLVQQESQDRDKVRARVMELTDAGCGNGMLQRQREMTRLAETGLEILPELIKEQNQESLGSLVYWYGFLAELKEPKVTPAALLNLARSGSANEHVMAAKIALTILDDRARAFLVEGLQRIAADESTEMGNLENALIDRAGWSHSKEAGELLSKMLAHPHPERKVAVCKALGNLGYAPALDDLKALAGPKGYVPYYAAEAVQKIGIVTSPDRAAKLAEVVRSNKKTGEFSWSPWALDHILHFNLVEAAGPLREHYDDLKKKDGAPKFGNDFAAKLLHAILKLGGKLSREETALLTELGRIPPAEKRPPEPDEAFVKGFDRSVWAPLAQRRKEEEARRAGPPRIPEERLPKFIKERIKFVMNHEMPDPSYLAPNAALALETLEEMIPAEFDEKEVDKLLTAYHYLARLREGMKTPEFILQRANGEFSTLQQRATAIVVTIADDRAEAWYLEKLNGPRLPYGLPPPGRLSGLKVKEALVKRFKESERDRLQLLEALVDRGCVEILPELRKMEAATKRYETRFAIERLGIFESPDRDAKLLAFATSLVRSGDFLSADWGLDQILRLNLKHLAPDLRKWYDQAKLKWAPSHDPHRLIYKMPWVLSKLGAPITPEEEELLKRSGRRP